MVFVGLAEFEWLLFLEISASSVSSPHLKVTTAISSKSFKGLVHRPFFTGDAS